TDTITNIGSDINIAGDLTLKTTGLGLASKQANIDALNAQTQAKYEADLAKYNQDLAEYNARYGLSSSSTSTTTTSSPSPRFASKFAPPPPTQPTPPTFLAPAQSNINIVGSNIKVGSGGISVAGDLEIKSEDNVLIKGSNIDVAGNAQIDSGDDINILFAVDSTSQSSSKNQSATIERVTSNIDVAGNLVLKAKDDINNIGSKIKSAENLEIIAGGNINNIALVDYKINNIALVNEIGDSGDSAIELINKTRNDVFKSGADKISSELLSRGNIESGGNLILVAGNDFNNLGSDIKSSGGALLQAGNDVNIASIELRDRNVTRWGSRKKGGTSITDTITNIGSDINIAGNLIINSNGLSESSNDDGGGDINIIGSNINVTGNGSITSDFGNINIVNAINSKMTQDSSWKKGTFHSRFDSVYDYKESAVESKLNFGGNLVVNAQLGITNLIGSSLKTGGNLNIGSFTVAQNNDGSYKTNADGTFETIDGGSVAGVNIKSAELRSEHAEIHKKTKLTLGDTLKTLNNPLKMSEKIFDIAKFIAISSFNSTTLEIDSGPKYKKSSASTRESTITQHSSTIGVGGNMMINSTSDVNILASNLNIAGNALFNIDGNLNISSATETTKTNSETQSIEIGTFQLNKDFAHASASASIKGEGNKYEESLTTTTQKSSNINIGRSMLANVTNNLSLANSGNLNITASNLSINQDAIIRTTNNFNLLSAQEITTQSTKESNLTVEVGAKVG
ncbi:MAG: hypothetical protein EBT63_06875, partial [Proteobacteria bacterium]|nr:hypothetical protein [Pseudomonadota bacterium]